MASWEASLVSASSRVWPEECTPTYLPTHPPTHLPTNLGGLGLARAGLAVDQDGLLAAEVGGVARLVGKQVGVAEF